MIGSDTLYGDDYSLTAQKSVRWFFRLLLSSLLLSIILLFTVHINDTVAFTQGEIISQDPQLDFKAPFEAQLSKIYVREGQQVKAGDTLMIIYNETDTKQYAIQKAEKDYLENKLASLQSLHLELSKKKNAAVAESNINSATRNINTENTKNNIQALLAQYRLQEEKLKNALERNKADSVLYSKDMLSRLEYNAGKDVTNDIRETLNATKNEIQKQQAQQDAGSNEFALKQHQLALKNIEVEESNLNVNQLQIDLQNQLVKANENLDLLGRELSKQYLVAVTAGTVTFIYNIRQSSNIINKNDLLLSIAPFQNNFYAKVILPENNIPYVKTKMPAHVELDAYYHLKYGVLTGDVAYVSARRENEKFYALIKLDNTKKFDLKSGYNISGEIITERMILFEYFLKKLFKEFDNKQS